MTSTLTGPSVVRIHIIAVAHEQIAAFDELDAHLLGEEHVLEIGAVVAARRQQHDDRIVVAAGATARKFSSSRSG